MGKKRDYNIDILKLIAAVFVVYQHACGKTIFEMGIESITKTAVPIFLMVTGYFYLSIVKRGNEKKQIKKILFYACIIVGGYFMLDFLHSILKYNWKAYLLQYLDISNIIKFIFLNDSISGDHSWYLWALLYVLVIMYIFKKKIKTNSITVLILFLLFTHLVVGKYSWIFFDKGLPYFYCRNFIMAGLPFFLLGYVICRNESIIQKYKRSWGKLVFVFSITSIVEYYILYLQGIQCSGYYISTIGLAISLFAKFLTMDEIAYSPIIASVSRRYIFPVYFIHVGFVVIEKKLINMDNGMGSVGFIFVLAASFITVAIYYKVKKIIETKRGLYDNI